MKNNFKVIVTDNQGRILNRRHFLTHTGLAAAAFSILTPSATQGAAAKKKAGGASGPAPAATAQTVEFPPVVSNITTKLNIGLIGCGGRGQWIADLFVKHGGYNLVGVADYFEDKATSAGDKFKVEVSQRFTGLNGYRKLLEQKLDAVVIQSPPYFHPEQAAAAVEAGKHVYVAKPIAVDVPGCRTIEASGRRATEKKLVFLADFQTRAHPAYQEAVKLVHEGKIGKLISGEATYQAGPVREEMHQLLLKNPADAETRLRAWIGDKVLSGDIITEQNIHALDVASWIINQEPIKASGTCLRGRAPLSIGCADRFSVTYHYPEFLLSFSSKQLGKGWNDIQCRFYGMDGTIDTHYFGEVRVYCDDAYNGGRLANLYADGAVRNIATFYNQITGGNHANPTVAPSVRSNLLTILGRTAAYRNGEVTWAELLKANEKLEVDLKGLKS